MSSTPHRPKAVVFDLGKVLLDFDYGIVIRAVAAKASASAAEIKTLIDQSPLLYRYETGLVDSQGFFQEICAATGYSQDFTTFGRLFGDIFTEIPSMVALNQNLRLAGIPTFIFSNTNELAIIQIRAHFPFFKNFNGFILSYEEKSMKPDSRIYEVVEERTGHVGADLLYIDDRPENIEAGARRSWQSLLHSDPAATIPEVLKRVGIGAAMM